MRQQKFLLTFLFFTFLQFAFAQQREVKGVVKDDTGVPIPGATVLVKDTPRGVATDFDGNFAIKVSDGETLQFSSTGMKTQEKKITKGINTLNIVLAADIQELEGVVVTGITTTDRRLFTGAADKIVAADAKIAGITDVSLSLIHI